MNIEKALKDFGFSEKELKIYIASLQLGKDTATNIARKSGIKRSTTYLVLEELSKKGFVGIQQTQHTTYFSPAHPKKILTKLKEKEKIIEKALPTLFAMYRKHSRKPSVEMFEGEEAMRQIYWDIIEYLKKGKEVLFFGFPDSVSFYDSLIELWYKESRNKRYNIRELLPTKINSRIKEYIKKQSNNKNPRHHIRILPKKGSLINDNAIFGNKLVIFSSAEEPFALIIHSSVIANSYRALFNVLWNASTHIVK